MKLLSREEHSFPLSSIEVWIGLIGDSRGNRERIVNGMELYGMQSEYCE